jgi:hypothetical protein
MPTYISLLRFTQKGVESKEMGGMPTTAALSPSREMCRGRWRPDGWGKLSDAAPGSLSPIEKAARAGRARAAKSAGRLTSWLLG